MQLEVCDTRGTKWNYVGVYGSSWNLPRNVFVEAANNGSNGSFYFHRAENSTCKLPLTSMEVHLLPLTSMEVSHGKFHGSKSTFPDFYGSFPASKCASMMVEKLLSWKLPWK